MLRLRRRLSKPFLPPWLSESVKIRLFYPKGSRRCASTCRSPTSSRVGAGGMRSPPAPALRVQHLLLAGPPAPRLPGEGEDETDPSVPTGVTEKPGALSHLEIALRAKRGQDEPIPASGSGYPHTPAWPWRWQVWSTRSRPAPHQPPAPQAASRLQRAPHYF